MKSLLTRAATGVLFVALVVVSILASGGIAKVINIFNIFLIFTCIAIYEYRSLINSRGNNLSIFFYVAALAVYFILAYIPLWNVVSTSLLMLLILGTLFMIPIVELFRKQENPFGNIAYSILGIIWIVVPLALINRIPTLLPEGKYLVLALFVLVWLHDTFAYCVGSLLGKHRLMLRVSPKKSWEGTIGSALLILLLAFFAPKILTMFPLDTIDWMLFAAIVIVLGTLGDLIESLFKRQMDVKDSGSILPGHGGILDRFDSILLIVPFILLYLHFIL